MTYRYGNPRPEFTDNRRFGCDQCGRGREMLEYIDELEARLAFLEATDRRSEDPEASPSDSVSPTQQADTEE